MPVRIHPHARKRLKERGATAEEAVKTLEQGERFQAKFGRTGFRCNLPFKGKWKEKKYNVKQLEVYAVQEEKDWVIITVLTKYF